jgi:recombinational DNA repair protein (RecF pathway)
MAKGVRTRGAKGSGGLELLSGGILTVYARPGRDLQTFKDFHPTAARPGRWRSPVVMAGGSLLAELILKHAGEDGNPMLFEALELALDRVAELAPGEDPAAVILTQAWTLVSELGYRPEVEHCVTCGRSVPMEEEVLTRFDYSGGGLRCPDCSEGTTGARLGREARNQLRSMVLGTAPGTPLTRESAHIALLDNFITYHISGGSPMKTMEVLRALLEGARA